MATISKIVPFKDWNEVVIPKGTPDLDYRVSLYSRKSVKRGHPMLDAKLTPMPADTKEST